MAITVKHKFVSAIPDGTDDTIVRPSNWNDDHDLTGTIPVANGGTGASTLTGYVKGTGTTAMTAASTIPNTDITGLGTASTKDAGSALGVATLDATGKVPVSELPAAVLGALSYQGTWNASTNTPTLTSSVGTKGYYYVVSVAGSTNLNGITDWQVGDWAVFNGSVWQKVDNTDAGGDVVGPASATDNAVARFDTTTGKLIQNSVTTIDDTGNASGILSQQFSNGSAVTLAAGKIWYDGSTGSWNAGMGGGNITQQIGEELFVYGKASATITDSPLQIIYQTGTVGASGVITFAPTIAGITDGTLILGVATESLALNAFGRITSYGVVRGITTNGTAFGETWADGDEIYYNPVTGNPTNIKPVAPNVKVSVGTLIKAGSGGSGSIQVEVNHGSVLGGTDSNVQLNGVSNGQIISYDGGNGYWKNTDLTAGTAISVTETANGVLTVNNTGVTSAVAGTGISVSGATGAVTVTNSAPDQTVVLTAGTGISTSGTYPNFTITNTSPSSGGTVTSVTGTSPVVSSGGNTPAISMPAATTSVSGYLTSTDWNTFNSKGSGTVTSVSGTASNISSTGGATPVIDLVSTAVTPATYTLATITVDAKGRITSASNGSGGTGTVTSVAQSFTGGLISVSGSPITTTGTLALTVAGTSGGIPYFSSASTWATSAALAANSLVIGGGAGVAPSTTTTGTGVVTALGVNTGTAGAFVVNGGVLGTPSSGTLTNCTFPTLNQNTTGTASNVTGTVAVANGGTGGTTAALGRTGLGATTVGANFFTLTNPSAITFPRMNADNTVSALDAATFRTAIGAGTSSTTGTVTSVGGTGTVNGITLTGTVTSSGNLTLGGTLSGVSLTTQVSGTLPIANGGSGATTAQTAMNAFAGAVTSGSYLRGNGTNVVMATIQAADVPTLNQNTTGTASNVTGTVAIGNGGTGQTTAVAAFNALNPMTTTGDIIYEASPTTAARLGIGSTGQVLTVSGGLPAWAAAPSSNITTLGLYENSATIAANYTIGTGNNAMSAGPITVNTSVTVTVPTGSTWTIV